MASYVVLARKWRPASFRDLVGQAHVSRTLANAIAQNRVAHAFLFTGVRGVGKTTSARILAKALNCLTPLGERDAAEPCLHCSACKEIAEGLDLDVREIDGASYTGVDEVRKLQESLPYQPGRDRYKIFIVDEVHMLSQNAWNALLKTLEEPPPHVKFILATTEVHKVPVTILSRVQRFDFKLISARTIGERLSTILQAENITFDARSVALVAREAAGSMRDALSLLDQVIAFSPNGLDGDQVASVLGVAGATTLLGIIEAVATAQPQSALGALTRLVEQGCEMAVVTRDLQQVLRNLAVCAVCAEPGPLVDAGPEELEALKALAARLPREDWLRLQHAFAEAFDGVVRSADPRTALEMLLIRLSLRPALLPLAPLVERLEALDRRLRAPERPSAAADRGPADRGPADRAPAVPPARARDAGPISAAPERARGRQGGPPHRDSSPGNRDSGEEPAPGLKVNAGSIGGWSSGGGPEWSAPPIDDDPALFDDESDFDPRPASASAPVAPAPVAPAPVTLTPVTPNPAAPAELTPAQVAPARVTPVQALSAPAPQTQVGGAEQAAALSAPPVASPSATVTSVAQASPVLQRFDRLLRAVEASRPDLAAILRHATPRQVDPDRLELGYEADYALVGNVRTTECTSLLERSAIELWGVKPEIVFSTGPQGQTLADLERAEREERRRQALERAENHPCVREAIDVLGARIKRVDLVDV